MASILVSTLSHPHAANPVTIRMRGMEMNHRLLVPEMRRPIHAPRGCGLSLAALFLIRRPFRDWYCITTVGTKNPRMINEANMANEAATAKPITDSMPDDALALNAATVVSIASTSARLTR